MPIHTTSEKPPERCWLWHAEDMDWFWPKSGTAHMDFSSRAYSHITHWADAKESDPWGPEWGAPLEVPTEYRFANPNRKVQRR